MCSIKEYKLKNIEPFNSLSELQIINIENSIKNIYVNKEQVIFSPMDKCNSIGVILSGSINMMKLLSNGKELRIDKLIAGSCFGELICFSNSYYPAWIKANEPSLIKIIPKKNLLELLKNRNFLMSFMNMISRKSINLTHKVELLTLKRVDQKIAYYILNFGKISCSISKLAEFIGVSREATSRALSKMEKTNVINSIKKLENILLE